MLEAALANSGEERRIGMTALADLAREEAFFLPLFDVVTVYGLNDTLQWEPRFDGRVRLNMMGLE